MINIIFLTILLTFFLLLLLVLLAEDWWLDRYYVNYAFGLAAFLLGAASLGLVVFGIGQEVSQEVEYRQADTNGRGVDLDNRLAHNIF